MKNCLVLSVVLCVLLAIGAEDCEENPTQNCDQFSCFCPCRPPGGGDLDVINPPLECQKLIKCAHVLECSAEFMACQKPAPTELCFCPCRIPFCGPDVLYYPSLNCLQRIKCQYGQAECSAAYINGSGK